MGPWRKLLGDQRWKAVPFYRATHCMQYVIVIRVRYTASVVSRLRLSELLITVNAILRLKQLTIT